MTRVYEGAMRATAGIRYIIVTTSVLALAGCASAPSPVTGGSSAACAAPVLQLTPEVAEPGHPLSISSTGWAPCNDTNEENSAPSWQSVTLEWVQDNDTTGLITVDVTDGRFNASVTVPANTVAGEASLRVITPDPDYGQDFPVAVE